MNIFTNLLKDTFLYGLATVLPRLMNLVLVGLHTAVLSTASYAENTSFYIYAGFANVLLTYGMETAFFRFYTLEEKSPKVFSTVLISLTTTSLSFLLFGFLFQEQLAHFLKIPVLQFQVLLSILVLDTLVVAGFVLYRIQGKAIKFASIKLLSLVTYVLGNFFFLWAVPKYNITLPDWLIFPKVFYIFISNLLGSFIVFIAIIPTYLKFELQFSKTLFKKMLNYGWPIMIAGFAFIVNENLDKLVLRDYLGKDIMGAYSGCYKLSVFLMLFIQAFRLGVEPLVFKESNKKNAKQTYAVIMKFFVIFASLGILFVLSFLDLFKELMIRDKSYWIAINIVPVILLANWCLGVYHSLSIWYKLTDRTRFGMYISIFGACITISLNYILVPKYGFMAAAYATLVAYGSMMVISYLLGQKYYAIPYPIGRLFGYLGIALLLSAVNLYVTPNSFILKGTSILVYLIIIAIFEKNSFNRLFNRI